MTICVKIVFDYFVAIIAMRSPYLSIFFGLSLLACCSLTACGTKGPLYIPEQRYPQADSNKPNNAPKAENKLEKSSNYTQPTSQ